MSDDVPPPPEPNQAELTRRLVDTLYTEAMVLADEARSYFDQQARDERMALDPLDRVGFSCESLKVTTRLMQGIAWLLNQRAVAAGEISAEEAAEADRRIGPAPASDAALLERLPPAAAEIIRASEILYDRLRRLDETSFGEPAAGSPARSLMSRLERSLDQAERPEA